MPDMIFQRLTVVEFTTDSDDFDAYVRGPAGKNKKKRKIKDGEALPRNTPGLYTLEVRDLQLRTLKVTLTNTGDPSDSLPSPAYSESGDETVIVSFQVL